MSLMVLSWVATTLTLKCCACGTFMFQKSIVFLTQVNYERKSSYLFLLFFLRDWGLLRPYPGKSKQAELVMAVGVSSGWHGWRDFSCCVWQMRWPGREQFTRSLAAFCFPEPTVLFKRKGGEKSLVVEETFPVQKEINTYYTVLLLFKR